MRKIVVATDFSARSDRAIRRATLIAGQFGAGLSLVHAVDDDQAVALIRAETHAAEALLAEQAHTIATVDRVPCLHSVVLGDPFVALTAFAAEASADLLVIGPHRRQTLQDVFVGTTAERIIRASDRAVLMCNGVPAALYRHVLIALDLASSDAAPLQALGSLDLGRNAELTALHVYDTPADHLIRRASIPEPQFAGYLAEEEKRNTAMLREVLASAGAGHIRAITRRNQTGCARMIAETARALAADLIVLGTRGHGMIERLVLGSVTEEVLRDGEIDVLAIPPAAKSVMASM